MNKHLTRNENIGFSLVLTGLLVLCLLLLILPTPITPKHPDISRNPRAVVGGVIEYSNGTCVNGSLTFWYYDTVYASIKLPQYANYFSTSFTMVLPMGAIYNATYEPIGENHFTQWWVFSIPLLVNQPVPKLMIPFSFIVNG